MPASTTTFEAPSDMKALISPSAPAQVRDRVLANPDLIGQTVEFRFLATSRVDGYLKGRVTRDSIARDSNLAAGHLDIVDALREARHRAQAVQLPTSSSAPTPRKAAPNRPASASRCWARSS